MSGLRRGVLAEGRFEKQRGRLFSIGFSPWLIFHSAVAYTVALRAWGGRRQPFTTLVFAAHGP